MVKNLLDILSSMSLGGVLLILFTYALINAIGDTKSEEDEEK